MFKIDAFRTKILRSLISKIETCRILPCHIHSESNKAERERLLAKLLTKHCVPDVETGKKYMDIGVVHCTVSPSSSEHLHSL